MHLRYLKQIDRQHSLFVCEFDTFERCIGFLLLKVYKLEQAVIFFPQKIVISIGLWYF